MAIVLTNALLLDIDPLRVETGGLRIEGGSIAARGAVQPQAGDEVIDCGGAVVLPGLVNGHTHLYSALAVGMPRPPRNPALAARHGRTCVRPRLQPVCASSAPAGSLLAKERPGLSEH